MIKINNVLQHTKSYNDNYDDDLYKELWHLDTNVSKKIQDPARSALDMKVIRCSANRQSHSKASPI